MHCIPRFSRASDRLERLEAAASSLSLSVQGGGRDGLGDGEALSDGIGRASREVLQALKLWEWAKVAMLVCRANKNSMTKRAEIRRRTQGSAGRKMRRGGA